MTFGAIQQHAGEREQFDVWNEVPLVPQTTGMSCWAAAAAMLIGWRDRIIVDPSSVASGAGRWAAYREGLEPTDVPALAAAWQLIAQPATQLTIPSLVELLRERGPLWLGEASPGLHSIVVTGIYGDGTPEQTFVRINDPWPIDRGERYVRSFAELRRNFLAATEVVGDHVQILHTGGRERGNSSWRRSQQRWSTTLDTGDDEMPDDRAPTSTLPGAGSRWFDAAELPGYGTGSSGVRLQWNDAAARSERVDLIVYLIGPASSRDVALDQRERPTISLAHTAEPRLLSDEGGGLEQLVEASLSAWGRTLGRSRPHIARLIHACDSEQEATLDQLLAHRHRRRVCNPEEVHWFGAREPLPANLASWATERRELDRFGHADLRDHGAALRLHPIPGPELPPVPDAPTYGTPMGLFARMRREFPSPSSAAALRGSVALTDVAEFPRPEELAEIVAEREPSSGEAQVLAIAKAATLQPGWASDANSVDYRHLARAGYLPTSGAFELGGASLAALAQANRFSVPESGRVLFALRGCMIVEPNDGAFHPLVQLSEDQPDHLEAHCVLGVWDRSNNHVAVFRGSTVPHHSLMRLQVGNARGCANMMLTGSYAFTVGVHRNAFHGFLIESSAKLVLRSRDDLVYTTTDDFDRCAPGDNVHPSFLPANAEFSSAGCLTVRGTASRWRNQGDAHRNPDDGTPGWASFRACAGLTRDRSDPAEDGRGFRLLMLTGREAHIVATERTAANLVRLRTGSRGPDVGGVQQFLARTRDAAGQPYYNGTIDDDFGPRCAEAWVRWQRDSSGSADGIVTPDDMLGMGLRLE